MKSVPELEAERNALVNAYEAAYTAIIDVNCRSLRKCMEIKNAIANYETKVQRASAELEQELKTIEQNFNQVGQ